MKDHPPQSYSIRRVQLGVLLRCFTCGEDTLHNVSVVDTMEDVADGCPPRQYTFRSCTHHKHEERVKGQERR